MMVLQQPVTVLRLIGTVYSEYSELANETLFKARLQACIWARCTLRAINLKVSYSFKCIVSQNCLQVSLTC